MDSNIEIKEEIVDHEPDENDYKVHIDEVKQEFYFGVKNEETINKSEPDVVKKEECIDEPSLNEEIILKDELISDVEEEKPFKDEILDNESISNGTEDIDNPDDHVEKLCAAVGLVKKRMMKGRRKQGGKPMYECNKCCKKYDSVKKIENHLTRSHIKCDFCQKTFPIRSDLKKHIIMHTGEKPHKCEICQKKFPLKGILTRHMKRHTSEVEYECNTCKKRFNNLRSMELHISRHTDEQLFKCKICNNKFVYKCNLMRHMDIHKGIRKFECNTCKKTFMQKASLKRHMNFHTKEKIDSNKS